MSRARLCLEQLTAQMVLVGRDPFQEYEFEAGDMRSRSRNDGTAPVIQAQFGMHEPVMGFLLESGHRESGVVFRHGELIEPGLQQVLGPGLMSIIIAIVVIDWTRFARVIRAEAMTQGAMDYVASAQVAGRTRLSTMVTEILPNVLPTITVLLTLEMGIAIIVEAILSFVNLSISTDDPTWGGMIAEGRTSIHQAWWVLVFPLITLFLTVLSFSQLGEGLKDRFDPVLR